MIIAIQDPLSQQALAARYGPGSFCNFLSLRHPLGATDWINLTGPMTATLQQQLEHDQNHNRLVPYAPRNLFPIAVTDNGEYVFWHTTPAQAPDSWTIAVNEPRGPEWFTYDGTLSSFLFATLSGQQCIPLFPDSLLSRGVSFTPAPALEARQTPTRSTARASGAMDSNTIRAWAREHGYAVPERGRIPAAIISAWREAHG